MTCVCGHPEEDHSRTGECKVDGCICGCYEEEDEELEELGYWVEDRLELDNKEGEESEDEGEEDDLDEDPW